MHPRFAAMLCLAALALPTSIVACQPSDAETQAQVPSSDSGAPAFAASAEGAADSPEAGETEPDGPSESDASPPPSDGGMTSFPDAALSSDGAVNCAPGWGDLDGGGALAPLAVQGNPILRNGSPFELYGVTRDALEWGASNWGGCGGDQHFAAGRAGHRLRDRQGDWVIAHDARRGAQGEDVVHGT
jgi:hypothetical protein